MSSRFETVALRALVEADEAKPFPGSTLRKPLYHGTETDFARFEKRKGVRQVMFAQVAAETNGFFFSESPSDARSYVPGNGYVLECFVNMRRPLLDPRDPRQTKALAHASYGNRLPSDKEEALLRVLAPVIEGSGENRFLHLMTRRVTVTDDWDIRAPLDYWIYQCVGPGGLLWDLIDKPAVVAEMVRAGYDGTFVNEPNDESGRSVFVPSPEQVRIVRHHDAARLA